MKHLNGHETKTHSIKRTPQGIAFVVRCCECLDKCDCKKDQNGAPTHFEKSFHIQGAHQFAKDKAALKRLYLEKQREVSETHESHLVAEAFVKEFATDDESCRGCGKET